MSLLFSPTTLGTLTLQNHLVMSPLTRNRATGNIPNELMAEYYAQRASAGLIITEGTSPSPNGLGYPRIPGIFSAEQIAGWKLVTDAVHAKGAKMFIQFMHCGRVGHPLNLPEGARVLGPSAVAAVGDMYTDAEGMKQNATPQAMTEADIKTAIAEYAQAAKHAVAAGFDGVELHGANGYLLEQFIRPNSNQRTDRYGGSIENRARLRIGSRRRDHRSDRQGQGRHTPVTVRGVQRHAAVRRNGSRLHLSCATTQCARTGLYSPGRPFADGCPNGT